MTTDLELLRIQGYIRRVTYDNCQYRWEMDTVSDSSGSWGINTSLETCIHRFDDHLIPPGGQSSHNTPTVSSAFFCNPIPQLVERLLWSATVTFILFWGGFNTVLMWAVARTLFRNIQLQYWGYLRVPTDWSVNLGGSCRWAHVILRGIALKVHVMHLKLP